ncbi:MAG: hypothetical protein WAM97_10745 [Acidimicrobiales bacterium]
MNITKWLQTDRYVASCTNRAVRLPYTATAPIRKRWRPFKLPVDVPGLISVV